MTSTTLCRRFVTFLPVLSRRAGNTSSARSRTRSSVGILHGRGGCVRVALLSYSPFSWRCS